MGSDDERRARLFCFMALTEKNIIDNAYYLLEKGSDLWDTDSDEYLTARGLANIAIGRWEGYENTRWEDLLTSYGDASGVTTTTTAGVYTYTAPSNTLYAPASYVVTVDGSGKRTFWQVIKPKQRFMYQTSDRVCWFTGNQKSGYVLHFNSGVNLTTGDTIDYDYYKKATLFTATSSTTEVPDPYFVSYYIAAHMAEEGIDPETYNMAEGRLEEMRTKNMSQSFGVSEDIPHTLDFGDGFGY